MVLRTLRSGGGGSMTDPWIAALIVVVRRPLRLGLASMSIMQVIHDRANGVEALIRLDTKKGKKYSVTPL